jgi:hypothetical protein
VLDAFPVIISPTAKSLLVETLRVPVFLSQLSTIPEVFGEDTISSCKNSLSFKETSKSGKCFSGISLPPELKESNLPTNSPLSVSTKPSRLYATVAPIPPRFLSTAIIGNNL